MSIREGNKLNKLEEDVRKMEREVEKLPHREELIDDVIRRLRAYEDGIRTDKGRITMKKNFIIENRKGIKDPDASPGVDPQKDNVVQMYFNEKRDGRLNHIFIGDASMEGFFNTSVISGRVVQKDDVDLDIANNGTIQLILYKDRKKDDGDDNYTDLVPSSSLVISSVEPYINQFPEIDNPEDLDGAFIQMSGSGQHGFSSIAHLTDEGGINTSLSTHIDTIEGTAGGHSGLVGLIHIGEDPPPETGQWIWVDTSE